MSKQQKQKSRRVRRAFTPEFKAEAVRLCRVGDRSVPQVARDLDLTETALRGWVHQATVDAGIGPPAALTTEELSTDTCRARAPITSAPCSILISSSPATPPRSTIADQRDRRCFMAGKRLMPPDMGLASGSVASKREASSMVAGRR